MPKTKFDALIYGHFHTGFIEKKESVTIANAGSTSLPKNQTEKSYLLLDGKTLYLKDLEGNVIDKADI
jgi:predicted phosphodiesterase